MMGAVSLVTFIAGAGAFVAEGALVWAETVDAKWKRQSAMNKRRKFIFKNSTSDLRR
jgi:hypothetical protein